MKKDEKLVPIPNYTGYYISNYGIVYSDKSGKLKPRKPYYRNGYALVNLMNNGISKNFLIHRLVAKAFIPNEKGLPEVNHIDKNRGNNQVSNLEWCDRKSNLYDSYSTMPPTRNYYRCALYKGKEYIKSFNGVRTAARYARNEFGCNPSSLEKYRRCGEFQIIVDGENIINAEKSIHATQDRRYVEFYRNGESIGIFKTIAEGVRYINKVYKAGINYDSFRMGTGKKEYDFKRIDEF